MARKTRRPTAGEDRANANRASVAELESRNTDDLIDLYASEPLPEDKFERLEVLRLLAKSPTWVPTHDPETGESLEGKDPVALAEQHWPSHMPAAHLSREAREREAALYRAAGEEPPVRR